MSPHITTLPANLSTPQTAHATLSDLAWSTAVPSTEHSLMYTHPYFEPPQQTNAYNADASTTTSYSTTHVLPWDVSTGYHTPEMTRYSSYPSHGSTWPASGYNSRYPHPIHQEETMPTTNFHVPSWQYQTTADLSAGIVLGPCGGRCHPYEPC